MKNFFTLRSKTSLILGASALALSLLSLNTQAATVFTENMGTGTGGTTLIPASTFQNTGTYTYSGTADTRNTGNSSGYTGASGGRNVWVGATTGIYFQMEGINTSGYTNLSLSFGAFKSGNASNLTLLVVEYSTDGSTWTTLTFPAQATGSGTANWRLITITGGTIPATSNLRLRWTNSTNADSYRIDDIKLTGDVASGPSLAANSLTAFGAQCINAGPYGPNSFTITGSDLTTADVTVGALSGFTYSTTALGPYTSSLTLSQPGGAYSQAIYVQFDPTAVQSYSGNIPVGGGGATGSNVAASGSGVNTAPVVTTGAASAITIASATVAGTLNTATSCGTVTAYGIEYSTTAGFTAGTGNPVASTNLSVTAFSSALAGLSPCTIYYTHAYATRSSGTTYGAQGTFTTDVIGAPVATAGTSMSSADFTANWGAVTGATGYQLDVSTSPTFGSVGGQMVGWDFDDGNATADSGIPANLSKTITTNSTGTISYPTGMILNTGWDGGSNSKYWMVDLVTTGYAGLTLSSVQQSSNTGPRDFKVQYRIGTGGAWTDVPSGSVTVANNLTTGVINALALPAACDNEAQVFLRWIMTSNTSANGGTTANGGTSRIDNISVDAAGSPSFVTGYNNLSVAGTSQVVTGLDPLTTYYYRVRAVGASCTSANSNVIDVTTAAGVNPSLIAGTLADFGDLCINTDAAPQAVTVEGFNLTTDAVTVGALAGFSYATDELGPYTSTLSITQPGGAFSQEIWVTFTPTAEQNYDGNITIGGGGAPNVTVEVTGNGINPAPELTTGAASAITIVSATVAGQITDAGCGTITAYGIEYSTTTGFTPGTGTQVASTNLSGNTYSSDLAGLSPCTPYYYVAYATRASGTTYGTEQSFTTATISTPVATAGTSVGTDAFTANWGTVSGATDYRLDVYTQSTTLATDLFISEYVEGSSNNKYIEIFNGTGAPVNLANYELRLFNNGASSPSNTAALSGTLANNTTRVYRNSSATIYGGTTTVSTAVGFNGNDAVALYKVSTSSYVDIIGQIGNDPGSAWTGGGLSTLDRTLVRKASVSGGVTTNPVGLGFPTLATEWDGYPIDDVSRLGSHTFNSLSQTFVPGYNDLLVAGTSEVVTGLDPGTTYYYAVRAESGTCTSASSDEIEVTTVGFGCTDPLANNYDANAATDNSTCTYCVPTITYNTPIPTPILIGTGIPVANSAVAVDCHPFTVGMNAFERFGPAIIPVGNVYTTTTGYSPTSMGDPTPNPAYARWNLLGSIDLGTFDFTQVNVFLDLDFDPGATPVWNTVNVSAAMIAQSMGNQHIYQAAENLKSPFWAIAFPGVTFDPTVPGIYDVRVRLESPTTNAELLSMSIQVVVNAAEGCMDPLAENYNPSAVTDDGSCTFCIPTITYNTPIPTPILIGTGIPTDNAAVSTDCHPFTVGVTAFERYVGAIIPSGNVYTTTTGYSPTSGSNPTPDPAFARWNLFGSIDLGSFDFTQVNVFLDLDFDPGATPVWNTVDVSANMIAQSMGNQHIFQASENLKSAFWATAFPGVTFDPTVAGIYDVRVRIVSPTTSTELLSMSIQVVVNATEGCMDPLAENYNPSAITDDGSCTFCAPTITYNTPIPTPILIGSGIPADNAAVSVDCHPFTVGLTAFERYVGAIVPASNVYTTTTGYSPTSGSNPTPDPAFARWSILGSVDLGAYDFTDVNLYLDLDFDPGVTPVWNTVNLSAAMIGNGLGSQHIYQASENLASAFWSVAFPGVTFDPNVAGIYDVRVRLESVVLGEELLSMSIQVVVEQTCVAHTGNTWYVNDASLVGDVYTTAVGSDSNTGTAECPFATIAYAIDQVSPGDIIMVDAGVYVQDLVITKPVDLRGVQYNADPNTRTGAESILYPATSDPDPSSATSMPVVYLDDNAANGTKINGFTVDGDNPALTSGVVNNGADMDAIEGIASYQGNGDLDIAFNKIRNFPYTGLDLANYQGVGSLSGTTVRNNLITNVYSAASGPAIILQYNFYADVTDNTLDQVRIGIQTGVQIQPSLGTPPVISGNTITSYRLGIFHNVQYTTATPFTIANNELLTYAGAATNSGIFIGVLDPTTSVTVQNNNVTGAQNGIMLWGSNSTGGVTIEGGTLTDCGTGVFVNNYDAYPPDPNQTRSTTAIVKDVNIVNAGIAGIHVKDNNLNTNPAATVHVDIEGTTTVNVAAGAVNVLVTGAKASATFLGADVDLTGSALRHIRLQSNGSTLPAGNIDATQVKFNGATATTATGFTIEDLIDHKVDLLGLGKVSFVPGEVFVTVNSFVAPNTVGSVQRGIDVSVANDIVHVNDGTYNEDVDVNKVITLMGNDRDLTILRGLYGNNITALSIGANATVRDLTSTRDFGANTAQWQASPKTGGVTFAGNNAIMDNVRVTGHRNGVYINNRQNVQVLNSIIEANRTGIQVGNDVSGTQIRNNFIQDNFTMGFLFNFGLTGTPNTTGLVVSENSFSGNWYTDVSYQGTPSTPVSGADFSCNWYGTSSPVVSATATSEPGYATQVPSQFGGTAPGPQVAQIMGTSAALVPYEPYGMAGTDDQPGTPGWQPVPGNCEVIYYSQASGNVSDPIWDIVPVGTAGPATFTASTSMVVQTGDVVVNTSNTDVKKVTVEAGASLSLNAGTDLNVNGDEVIFDGAFAAADLSTLSLLSTKATILASDGGALNLWNLTVNTPAGTLTDATISIRGTLQLNGGEFNADLADVTLASTATGTGRLGPVAATASYTGNMTVQRYIPAGHTNWRMLGSPVAGQTVNNWKDDFYTAGFPGSHYPNFYNPVGSGILWPSIRYYDETVVSTNADNGLLGVTSNLQPLNMGQGFQAWSGDNFNTTTAFTVDVKGAPYIAQTPIALPMSFTSSGSLVADGWNLVSNPVPSPIDFTLVNRGTDVQNAYWIFDPVAGNLKAWTSGLGQGTLNGVIQSSQGFYLKANGAALTTTVSESAKVDEHVGGTFGGSQNAVLPILNLTINSTLNSYSDEATIVFANGTPDYDAMDALKFTFKTIGAPQVSILSNDGQNLAVDFYGDYASEIQIPLLVNADVTGTYTLSASIAGINNLSCLSIKDLQTGTITPLTDGATYSFTINASDDANSPRFLLNGTAPLPLVMDNALCSDQNGAATVVVNEGPVNIQWTDVFGNVLLNMTDIAGGVAEFEAAAGNYMVRVTPGGACGELVADFSITAPAAIEAGSATSATTCPNAMDGTADVMVMGGIAPYTYLWSNGSTGANITDAAGSYTVTITDANGCTEQVATVVPAGEGTIASFEMIGTNAVANTAVDFTNTSVLGEDFTWDFGDGTTSTDLNATHTWTLPGTYTVTLTASGGACADVFTMELTVDATTAIEATTPSGPLAVWATPDHIVIQHSFNNSPVDVDVYDATGRLAISRGSIVNPGRILINDRSLNTGVWFVRVKSGDTERSFRVPLIR